MLNNLHHKSRNIKFVNISPGYMALLPTDSVENGILVRKSEFKRQDVCESLNQLRSSDFSLSNLISIGSFEKLKTTYMASMSDMNLADKFEDFNFNANITNHE